MESLQSDSIVGTSTMLFLMQRLRHCVIQIHYSDGGGSSASRPLLASYDPHRDARSEPRAATRPRPLQRLLASTQHYSDGHALEQSSHTHRH